ncbi:MAG: 4-hydroxy-tetrahydrodipicolinate reductase [Candidatus Omnitrophota bacterium]
MIKLAIAGACGKMGTRILNLAQADKYFKVTVLLEHSSSPKISEEISGIKITSNLEEIKNSDILIDFTLPEATLEHLKFCLANKKPIVIGTTGFSAEQISVIKEVAKKIPVVFSPNMSIGVNVLFRMLKEAASKLKDYKIKIYEAHHIHKKDSPSGTAKKLAQIIKAASGIEVTDFDVKREGEIIGDHKVTFEGPFDTIELSHFAKTRDIFASGAITAAKWLVNKKPGLYDMQDILN